jgi:hypothetical protein
MPLRHLLTLTLVALFALVPMSPLGQVSPTQPTPDEARQQHLGLHWIGEWPPSETVENVTDEEGNFLWVGLATETVDCLVVDTSNYRYTELYDANEVAWSFGDVGSTIISIINQVSASTEDSGNTMVIATGEQGQQLVFISELHAWALAHLTGPDTNSALYIELWETEANEGVLLHCDGPPIEEFNDAFDEFEAIRGGISFPNNTYDPAGEPFAQPTPMPDATPSAA